MNNTDLVELSDSQIDMVAGGPLPLVVVFAIGVSSGGGLTALGIYLYEKHK